MRSPKRPSSGIRMRPYRIVVVEDDAGARDLVVDLMERDDHLVRAFSDAEHALSDIDRATADVVITDLQLEGMTGSELASMLRCAPPTRHIALLAISGRVDPDWRVVRHFDAYLRKPFDVAVLSRLVLELAESAVLAGCRLESRG